MGRCLPPESELFEYSDFVSFDSASNSLTPFLSSARQLLNCSYFLYTVCTQQSVFASPLHCPAPSYIYNGQLCTAILNIFIAQLPANSFLSAMYCTVYSNTVLYIFIAQLPAVSSLSAI